MSYCIRSKPFLKLGFDKFSCVRYFSINKQDAFVNGEWVKGSGGELFDITNPVNNEVIAKVPNLTAADVSKAIDAAADSFKKWGQTTAKERSYLLRQWFNKINDNSDELSQILSLESGKPLAEAQGEVVYGNSFIEWYSEEARRSYGEVVPSPVRSKSIFHIKQPIGVASVITPWNFPVAMITRKVGAALAAGCTVVIKPAEDTPLSALALAHYAKEVGIPPGVVNVVTCGRDRIGDIGRVLCQHSSIAGITFTGSTNVGKKLYDLCASGIKRLSLELGGNAPFIVFESADINKAIEGLIASKFRNSGQTCVSANRILIQETIFKEFIHKLKDTITSKYFDSLGKMTDKHILSPMINKPQLSKVESIVKDAVDKGATLHCGGKTADYVGQLFFEPTLITDINHKMLCYSEEIFGPVASCIQFSNEEEALKIANSTERGLAGYFYSNDLNQISRVVNKLEVGMVGINEGIISTAEAAFGGVKESGLGREGSHYGLDEFLNIKYVCLGNLCL